MNSFAICRGLKVVWPLLLSCSRKSHLCQADWMSEFSRNPLWIGSHCSRGDWAYLGGSLQQPNSAARSDSTYGTHGTWMHLICFFIFWNNKQLTSSFWFLHVFFWWITCWLLWFCISPPDWDWGPRPLNVQAYLEQPLGFEPLMEAQRPFETVPEDDLPPSSEIPEANDATDLKEQRIDDDWSSRLLASLCRQESLCCTKREIFRSSEEASTSARNTDKRCPSWKIMGDHHLAKNHGTCSCVT